MFCVELLATIFKESLVLLLRDLCFAARFASNSELRLSVMFEMFLLNLIMFSFFLCFRFAHVQEEPNRLYDRESIPDESAFIDTGRTNLIEPNQARFMRSADG